jgi:hypothetical protein
MIMTRVLGATPPDVAPGVGLVLGATPAAVAPGVGVVLAPQAVNMTDVASATIVVIIRNTARRVGDIGAFVMSGKAPSEGDNALYRGLDHFENPRAQRPGPASRKGGNASRW